MEQGISESMVDARSKERVSELIEDAVKKGACISAGGDREGMLDQASVVDGVTPAMRIYSEESFGPVVTVIRVNGDEEALRVANDTEYGLTAAILSRDLARGWTLASLVQTGICHIKTSRRCFSVA